MKLKYDDKVIFKLDGEELEYTVCIDHLYGSESNTQIFELLKLDKGDFCTKAYGYPNDGGEWPSSKMDGYKALTRCVKALAEEVAKKGGTTTVNGEEIGVEKVSSGIKVGGFYKPKDEEKCGVFKAHDGEYIEITSIHGGINYIIYQDNKKVSSCGPHCFTKDNLTEHMPDFKIKVNPKQSEKIQKICFGRGMKWKSGNNEVKYPDSPYLFIENVISREREGREEYFQEQVNLEIQADEFIKLYGEEKTDHSFLTGMEEEFYKRWEGLIKPSFDSNPFSVLSRSTYSKPKKKGGIKTMLKKLTNFLDTTLKGSSRDYYKLGWVLIDNEDELCVTDAGIEAVAFCQLMDKDLADYAKKEVARLKKEEDKK